MFQTSSEHGWFLIGMHLASRSNAFGFLFDAFGFLFDCVGLLFFRMRLASRSNVFYTMIEHVQAVE